MERTIGPSRAGRGNTKFLISSLRVQMFPAKWCATKYIYIYIMFVFVVYNVLSVLGLPPKTEPPEVWGFLQFHSDAQAE